MGKYIKYSFNNSFRSGFLECFSCTKRNTIITKRIIPKHIEKTLSLMVIATKEPNNAPNITGKAYGSTSLTLNIPCFKNKAEPKASCNNTPTLLTALAPCEGSPIAKYKAILTMVPPAERVFIKPTSMPETTNIIIVVKVKIVMIYLFIFGASSESFFILLCLSIFDLLSCSIFFSFNNCCGVSTSLKTSVYF